MEDGMKKYSGNCHCGSINFTFNSNEIEDGLRCNCSICKRRGAVMTSFTISQDDFHIEAKDGLLGMYQFDSKVAKHYFCKQCGIYPFHETMIKPGYFRVNLGCVDSVDALNLPVVVHDGKNQ